LNAATYNVYDVFGVNDANVSDSDDVVATWAPSRYTRYPDRIGPPAGRTHDRRIAAVPRTVPSPVGAAGTVGFVIGAEFGEQPAAEHAWIWNE
jgi:hypothetical protein